MEFNMQERVASFELRLVLGALCDVVESEMDEISNVRVSLAGWRGTSRLEIRGADKQISPMVFDRVEGGMPDSQTPGWVRRSGVEIGEGSDELARTRGLRSLLGD